MASAANGDLVSCSGEEAVGVGGVAKAVCKEGTDHAWEPEPQGC